MQGSFVDQIWGRWENKVIFLASTPHLLDLLVYHAASRASLDLVKTVALFIIAKTWKWCKCPPMDEWVKKLWGDIYMYVCTQIYICVYTHIYVYIHTHKMEHYLAIKHEETPTICNNTNGPWRHYCKWNKPNRPRLYDLPYIWNLKNKKPKTYIRNQTCD